MAIKVTEEMARAFSLAFYGHNRFTKDQYLLDAIRNALAATLADAPDRYHGGFEAAREMAAQVAELPNGLSVIVDLDTGEAIAKVIRAMELPGPK